MYLVCVIFIKVTNTAAASDDIAAADSEAETMENNLIFFFFWNNEKQYLHYSIYNAYVVFVSPAKLSKSVCSLIL